MNIIVTGNPATGKTFIAKKLAKSLNMQYIDVSDLIKKNKIHEGYDRKSKSYVVPIPKLKAALKPYLKQGNVIIDSHLSHYLSPKNIDVAIVTRCTDLKKLKKRLEKRNYSKKKVRENLDCEIFDICLIESEEQKHNVITVNTIKKVDISKLTKEIISL